MRSKADVGHVSNVPDFASFSSLARPSCASWHVGNVPHDQFSTLLRLRVKRMQTCGDV